MPVVPLAAVAGSLVFITPNESQKHEHEPDYEIYAKSPLPNTAGTKLPKRPNDGPKTVVDS